LIFDAATLTAADFDQILSINDNNSIVASAPKLLGSVTVNDYNLVLAGVDLSGEFAVKPWLRFHEDQGNAEANSNYTDLKNDESTMEMSYTALVLDRITDVPELDRKQVILGSNVAQLLKIKNDDLIELEGAIYHVIGILVETGMSEDNQILMNLTEAQAILNKPGELTVVELAADFSQLNEEILIARLSNALPHVSVTGVRQAVMGRNELLNTLTHFGLFSSAVIIVTSILIVILTMQASVRERTREIGIFRAIGFRSKHIFMIIAFESLVISIIGGAIGYHLGFLAARAAVPLLSGIAAGNSWQPATFLLVTVLTAVSGILAGSLPAIKAAKLNPADALRFS